MDQRIKQDEIINLGSNIRNLRLKNGYTQEDVVRLLQLAGNSISRATYSKIEMGIHHVTASQLELLRDIFRTDYDTLLKHTETENL